MAIPLKLGFYKRWIIWLETTTPITSITRFNQDSELLKSVAAKTYFSQNKFQSTGLIGILLLTNASSFLSTERMASAVRSLLLATALLRLRLYTLQTPWDLLEAQRTCLDRGVRCTWALKVVNPVCMVSKVRKLAGDQNLWCLTLMMIYIRVQSRSKEATWLIGKTKLLRLLYPTKSRPSRQDQWLKSQTWQLRRKLLKLRELLSAKPKQWKWQMLQSTGINPNHLGQPSNRRQMLQLRDRRSHSKLLKWKQLGRCLTKRNLSLRSQMDPKFSSQTCQQKKKLLKLRELLSAKPKQWKRQMLQSTGSNNKSHLVLQNLKWQKSRNRELLKGKLRLMRNLIFRM